MSHNHTSSIMEDMSEIGSFVEKMKDEYTPNETEMFISEYNSEHEKAVDLMTVAVQKILDECKFYGSDSIVHGDELDLGFFHDVLDAARINIEEDL